MKNILIIVKNALEDMTTALSKTYLLDPERSVAISRCNDSKTDH
ncbi:hypothetical protein UF75_0078 [Desulfosporosinus sp. I2]|nr:hypothetical protein UF75_0078 [Desulfosporosinus sp. I2]